MKFLNKSLVIFLVGLWFNQVVGFSYSYSYSTHTNTIDDGHKVVTQIESTHKDLGRPPKVDRKVIVGPSSFNQQHANKLIADAQVLNNRIGTGLEFGEPKSHWSTGSVHQQHIPPVFRQQIGGHYRQRGFITKARTVESPALSVDSGGRANNGGVAAEIAKLLNIKQGYHSDFYNQADGSNRPTETTKRPADAIEDSVRSAIVRMFHEQANEHNNSQQHGQNRVH